MPWLAKTFPTMRPPLACQRESSPGSSSDGRASSKRRGLLLGCLLDSALRCWTSQSLEIQAGRPPVETNPHI
jgi:hypothetical protein